MHKINSICLLTAFPVLMTAASPDVISAYAGGGPNNLPATTANIQWPLGIAVDNVGNDYFTSLNIVFKVSPAGVLTIFAGVANSGYSGDGGPATQATLLDPYGVATDSSGGVYIADTGNCIIRKVTAKTGVIETVAGTPEKCGFSGDGASATSAELSSPTGVAVDGSGNICIADQKNQRIRKVTASTGKISTLAGTGKVGFSGDGGPAISAELDDPYTVAVDSFGNVYIADQNNYLIRKVTAGTGLISTYAGDRSKGFSGDGGYATVAEIGSVYGIALDAAGNLFIADETYDVVREVNTSGIISTVAGTPRSCEFEGDGGPATSARMCSPYGLAVSTSGNTDQLYIVDYGDLRIRKAILGGNINTVAGNGLLTYAPGVTATGASLYYPYGESFDASGDTYIADTKNCIVRKATKSSGDISTIAGTPPYWNIDDFSTCGYSGDGGAATSAMLNNPQKAIADSYGNVYIADTQNCVIRKVTASSGDISTFAGTPNSCSFGGDGGSAISAHLNLPTGLAFDSSGNLYIADQANNVIREVFAATEKIETVAGNNAKGRGFSGDGGPATSAQLNSPHDIGFDASGDLLIADTTNNRVRVVSTSGIINTIAGNGPPAYTGDGVPATQTGLYSPQAVAVDAAGDVLIADYGNNRIRWINGHGTIYTVAGDGNFGYATPGVPARSTNLAGPADVILDASGNIYVDDTGSGRILEVSAIPNVNPSAYSLSFSGQQVGSTSPPKSITLKGVGPLTIDSVSTTGPFTESNDCPSDLSSGESCSVEVSFTPSAVGPATGTLVVPSNAFFNPGLTISLRGTGVAAASSSGATSK
ncbi:MAG TPA: choice-of-anchor D domain-containing protein [Bryobacteraceae bacterium]|nr:choice-of-anchor D domain-containing protein [Bryobacteraceae bacterium]